MAARRDAALTPAPLGDADALVLDPADGDATRPRVAAARFRHSGRISDVAAASAALALGDWVEAVTERGPEFGRVVVAADQIVFDSRGERPPLPVRRHAAVAPAAPDPRCLVAEAAACRERIDPGDAARLIGALGPCGRSPGGRSVEDERYARLRAALPWLGQVVEIAAGAGMVVARDFIRQRVTVRLDRDGSEVVVPAADLAAETHLDDTGGAAAVGAGDGAT